MNLAFDDDRYYSFIAFMAISIALMADSLLFLLVPITVVNSSDSKYDAAWRNAFRKLIRPRNAMQHLKVVHTSHVFMSFYLATFIAQHTINEEYLNVYGGAIGDAFAWLLQRILYADIRRDLMAVDPRIDQIIARCLQSFAIVLGTFALILIFLGLLGPFLRLQTYDGSVLKDIKDFAQQVRVTFDEVVYYIREMANAMNPFCDIKSIADCAVTCVT